MLPRARRGDELIRIAAYKLTTAEVGGFNEHHVFAMLSQRLCLDIDLLSAGAAELADRSVSHHMRLFTVDNAKLYTHSPSEPILALGAARWYNSRAVHGYCTIPACPRCG